jgi:hypothetical protein
LPNSGQRLHRRVLESESVLTVGIQAEARKEPGIGPNSATDAAAAKAAAFLHDRQLQSATRRHRITRLHFYPSILSFNFLTLFAGL